MFRNTFVNIQITGRRRAVAANVAAGGGRSRRGRRVLKTGFTASKVAPRSRQINKIAGQTSVRLSCSIL